MSAWPRAYTKPREYAACAGVYILTVVFAVLYCPQSEFGGTCTAVLCMYY